MNESIGLFRWSYDAKLLQARNGWRLTNFANGASLAVSPEEGNDLASVSGLSIPFRIPGSISQDTRETLCDREILIPCEEFNRYEERVRKRIAVSIRSSHGFIIMPTEKCNFRCTYCYETFERGRMSKANASRMSAAIAKAAAAAPAFSLGFFGGEPLQCADLVLEFSARAFEIMRERGMAYGASIATNGFQLDSELFHRLLDVGVVSYQITLDGPRHVHDRKRITIAGRPTFDRILRNLADMSKSTAQFSCILRCNVKDSERAALLEFLAGPEGAILRADSRFVIDVHEIWHSDKVQPPSSDQECASAMTSHLDYYLLNRELQEMQMSTVAYSHIPGLLGSSCYAGKPNWFVVGSDLSLYKCTVAFDNPKNKVGRVAEDGELVFDKRMNELWTGSNALTDLGCGACHLRVPCGGIACPLTRFTTGMKSCLDLKSTQALKRWGANWPSETPEGSGVVASD